MWNRTGRWVLPASVLALATFGVAGEIGYVEDFALSRDRAASLRQLIPGTEDFYFYHSLQLLNTEQYETLDAQIAPWLERFGQTPRLTEIQTRAALLTYDRNPKRTLTFLRDKLGLRFDHQRNIPGAVPQLPTTLDPSIISRATLKSHSLANWPNLDNFENSALDWLAADNLDWERRRNLLQRLTRPDVPNLPRLIADDLRSPRPAPFGSMAIHQQLTLEQMEELARLQPALRDQQAFVHAAIAKLRPGADDDWRHDPKLARAYSDRLLQFVRKLSPSHNSLKASVLYYRLALDRAQGTYNSALFMEYLQLPRQQPYMAKALLEGDGRNRADLNADFSAMMPFAPVRSDEAMVRSYLLHFLITAESPREFEPYINDVYLRTVFAEAKVTAGLGDPERWASQLSPETFRQLKERVDIDFAFTNAASFSANEPVRLDVFIKNVPNLVIKVFEINTRNYYRTHLREVSTDINLDGLTANSERAHTSAEPPLRRVQQRFEFPELSKPGVYVVDFIGGGKSSRALIRKGMLRPLVATGTAGLSITVVDDVNVPAPDARIWLGGQEFAPVDGRIIVPFSTSPGRRPIVITRGDFSCLGHIDHPAEQYALVAGIHVDREALLARRVARLIVRPGLFLNGNPVSLQLLEEVRLQLTSTDQDGIVTTTTIPNFKVFEDRESTHDFRTPPRLARLDVSLKARVRNLSEATKVDLGAARSFPINEIDATDMIECLHLAKFGPDYAIEIRGRTGEVRADRAVRLELKHRDFKNTAQVMLKSDARGRIVLGPLAEITAVTATGPDGVARTWPIMGDPVTYPPLVHARNGTTIVLPWTGASPVQRDEVALFDVRGETVRADLFSALSARDGRLELRGLAPGDYVLWIKRERDPIRIRVADGPDVAGFVLSRVRHLELAGLKPVQIASIAPDAENLVIKLADASKFARVHVFGARYRPAFPAFGDLAKVRAPALGGVLPAHAESNFLTGRNIGDELQYVLDRRQQKQFPGNMLQRPELLLNPWAVRSTETGEQMATGGDNFKPAAPPAPSSAMPTPGDAGANLSAPFDRGEYSNLDFLADAAAVLTNLVPDQDGVVRVPRTQLGPHSIVHVVAVDPLNTVSRVVALPEQPASVLDLRLATGLDPQGHFTQQKQITLLAPKETFSLADALSGRFEAYDTLARVFTLYSTLDREPKLAQFRFILEWPKLKIEEKRSQYSKYACHELNFFLFKKDPEFFAAVVKPHIANKKDKTFLDRWLLEEDLAEFLRPWQFDRLNAVEQVLLAQRIAGEIPRTARSFSDRLRLQPPNLDRFRTLFETAILGTSLDAEDKSGQGLLRLEPKFKILNDLQKDPGATGGRFGGAGGQGAGGAFKSEMERGPRGAAGAPGAAPAGRPSAMPPARDGTIRNKADGAEKLDFRANERKLAEVAQLFRRVPPTQEWAENNYHHLPIGQQIASLVPIGAFWQDYLKHTGPAPFLSKHLADAARNFTEAMFALAVLDLPFDGDNAVVKYDGAKMSYTPAGPAVAFHEEIRSVGGPAPVVQILVSQNFYRHGDRFREEDGEKSDKFITGEFIAQTVYGCQVVITNPTSSRQRLTALLQVPVGSIPLAKAPETRSVALDLEPYRTQTLDYLFYFPLPGRFAHFPIHVARNEALVASTPPATFEVLDKPSKLDTTSWEYVSQNGTAEEVLGFLGRENASALDLEKIAFRMKDKAFFERTLALLRERHVYQPTLWSYSIHHDVPSAIREFLVHSDALAEQCGGPIDSALVTFDPVARHTFEHLEYKPLVNARAHSLGHRRQIVNDRFHEQYDRLLHMLSYRKQLTDADLLAVTYALLLQDRIAEALEFFGRINPERVPTRMQYDYCAAYLAMFGPSPQTARSLAAKYGAYPVDRWRQAFAEIVNHLDEAEGKAMQIANADDRNQKQGQLAASEPTFEVAIDNQNVQLRWQNLKTVRVNYYLMDVEVLFSRSPFAQDFGSQFSTIRPNATQEIALPAGQSRLTVPLPADLVKRNVLVEVVAAGKSRSAPYYANAMDVQLTENYGQMRIASAEGKPIPKVYVKVYARLANGEVKFYKDGYTDLRGRFDYASVSTPEKSPIARFAILALSDERGALIREAAPPQQ